MPDERDVVFGDEYFVGFRLTLSSNRGKRALKKWQCLRKKVGKLLWKYDWWDNSLLGMVNADRFPLVEKAIT